MIERPVSEKKTKLCPICGESIIDRVTNKGTRFVASVYHSNGKNVIIVKNNVEIEHLCLTFQARYDRV